MGQARPDRAAGEAHGGGRLGVAERAGCGAGGGEGRGGRCRGLGGQESVAGPGGPGEQRRRERIIRCPPPIWKRFAKVSGKRWSALRTCSASAKISRSTAARS